MRVLRFLTGVNFHWREIITITFLYISIRDNTKITKTNVSLYSNDLIKFFSRKLFSGTLNCTVPWLLIKSFEKSGFCWKISKMHPFSVSTTQKVQNVHFFNFFPRKNPLGVLKIEVYPMGKWISFLMSACLPDSNTVEILKIWQIFNSLPYLHMGLRDLSSTP